MYKILVSLVVMIFISGCSGKATIVDDMQTSKSYCRSNGCSWDWNSNISKMNKTIDFGEFIIASKNEFMIFADLRSKVTEAVLKSKISDIKLQ